jgi:hypothetical protein
MVAAQAGKFIALPAPIAKVSASSPQGPMLSVIVSTARSSAMTRIQAWAMIRKMRRSMMSAKAPAGSASRKTGSMEAAWTRLTSIGLGSRLVISQPAPVFCIQPPMLLASVASHRVRKTRCRSGRKARGSGRERAINRFCPPPPATPSKSRTTIL